MMPAMDQNLRVPGPTPLPLEVREAQSAPMIDHRGTEFGEMLREISTGLADLIGTSGEVLLLTGSGIGALEAAVVNTLSPGDRVLGVTIGSFGDRFAKIASAFGADVERFEVPWGRPPTRPRWPHTSPPIPPYRAVLLTHNETSTGVTNPLRELAAVVRDAPGDSAGGGRRHQRAGCDALRDGRLGDRPGGERQPEGLHGRRRGSRSPRSASAPGRRTRAPACRASTGTLAEARTWAEKGQTPWTPAVSVLFGLRVGVRRLIAEGRERTWARHAAIAEAVQAGLEALGPPARRRARAIDPTPSPPPGCPTASNGRRSTPPCAPRG